LGTSKVAAVQCEDVEKMYARSRGAPYQANRALAVLSKMISLAIKWRMRTDNPVRGIEKAPELKRERVLTQAEIATLADAPNSHAERVSAETVRLMLITGSRKGDACRDVGSI
jgi:integrase